ncbi:MAG: polysaccharide biosynthesis C-terminal domain-containing protein [Collinsella stercoris]|uniref:polysaccharide biosynthesis C-terminal domain-containing protein n=1 Tax=Collinsella stercoris TaxID=147206 RepID=UPI003995D2F9
MLAASMALAFGISAVAPEFVPVFLGEGYEPCVGIMTFLVVIIPVISMTNVIGKQYLLPLSRDREYTFSLIVGAALNVAVNVLLIPRVGAVGAAIGTIVAEVSILIVQVICVRGELPLLVYWRDSIPYVAMGTLMFMRYERFLR